MTCQLKNPSETSPNSLQEAGLIEIPAAGPSSEETSEREDCSGRSGPSASLRRSPPGGEALAEIDRSHVDAGPETVEYGGHAQVPALDEGVHGQPRGCDPRATQRGHVLHALAEITRVPEIEGAVM